jgi:hypothetical protein
VEQRTLLGDTMILDVFRGYMSDVHHNGKMGLDRHFFFGFPPLLMLSKQSTQVVQVLKNNSSYGLSQLVRLGMDKRPSCTCNMSTDDSCIQHALICT